MKRQDGQVKVIGKLMISERYYCAGEFRKNGSLLKEGCGRMFAHVGRCPFCGCKTSSQTELGARMG